MAYSSLFIYSVCIFLAIILAPAHITSAPETRSKFNTNNSSSISFVDCHRGEVKTVFVSECSNSHGGGCIFRTGRRYTFGMNFVPEFNHTEVVANMKLDLFSRLSVVRDMPVCQLGYLSCPLKAGNIFDFECTTVNINVPWWFPTHILQNVPLIAELQDTTTRNTVACIRMLISVM